MTTSIHSTHTVYNVVAIRSTIMDIPTVLTPFIMECMHNTPSRKGLEKSILGIVCHLEKLCELLFLNFEWAIKRKIALNARNYKENKTNNGTRTEYKKYADPCKNPCSTERSTIDFLTKDKDLRSVASLDLSTLGGKLMTHLHVSNSIRGWKTSHTPRNVVLSILRDIGNLSEIFQCIPDGTRTLDKTVVDKAGQEIADVVIYTLHLALGFGILF